MEPPPYKLFFSNPFDGLNICFKYNKNVSRRKKVFCFDLKIPLSYSVAAFYCRAGPRR